MGVMGWMCSRRSRRTNGWKEVVLAVLAVLTVLTRLGLRS